MARMPANGFWGPAQDATLERLLSEGKTGRQIAAEMGYSPSTISEKRRAAHPEDKVVNARAASVRVDWEPPKPPVCKFAAASRAYCAALDRLWKSPPAKRAGAANAVAAALRAMMAEWHAFAATQDGPVPEVA